MAAAPAARTEGSEPAKGPTLPPEAPPPLLPPSSPPPPLELEGEAAPPESPLEAPPAEDAAAADAAAAAPLCLEGAGATHRPRGRAGPAPTSARSRAQRWK